MFQLFSPDFSEVSSILGLSGGAAYAAANGYLDGLARWRQGPGASEDGQNMGGNMIEILDWDRFIIDGNMIDILDLYGFVRWSLDICR